MSLNNLGLGDLALLAVILYLMGLLLRALVGYHRDGWRHFRHTPHSHTACSICAPWAGVGIDAQNNGKLLTKENH